MKKIFLMAALVAVMFSGCTRQTCEQGTTCKVLDRSGFQPETYPPSSVQVGTYGKLIAVETVMHTMNETITVRMKDEMNLVTQVRFQLRMGEKPESLNAVFNDIKPDAAGLISLVQIYNVYGKMIVNEETRKILSAYKMGDVQDNFSHISADIYKRVSEAFKPTPLIISNVSLGKLDYPQVIDDAIQSAAKRELEIKQAEADVQVKLTELAGKEKLADGQYRIKMKEATRIRDYNKMIAEGITPALLELRKLEVQEAMVTTIEKGDATTIFIPYGSQNTVGMQTRMYSK